MRLEPFKVTTVLSILHTPMKLVELHKKMHVTLWLKHFVNFINGILDGCVA
jgi:hypothetical protein